MGFVLKYVLEHGSGRLSYRRAFPQHLRPHIVGQVSELKVSLGHKSSLDVARAYAEACERYERMYADASRRASGKFDRLDEAAISLVVASYKHNSLYDDDDERSDPSKGELYQTLLLDVRSIEGARIEPKYAGDSRGRWSSKQIDTNTEMRDHYKSLRGRGDVDAIVDLWKWEALQLCEDAGLTVDPKDEASVVKLCWALNDAGIEVTELLLQRFNGDYVATPTGLVTVLCRSLESLKLVQGDLRDDEAFRRVQAGSGADCADQWAIAATCIG